MYPYHKAAIYHSMVRVQLSTQYHSPPVYPNHRAVTYRIKVRVQMSMVYYLQTMHLCHRAVTSLLVVRLLVSVANISTVPHDDLYHSVVKAHSQETSNLSTSIPQGCNLPFSGQTVDLKVMSHTLYLPV